MSRGKITEELFEGGLEAVGLGDTGVFIGYGLSEIFGFDEGVGCSHRWFYRLHTR